MDWAVWLLLQMRMLLQIAKTGQMQRRLFVPGVDAVGYQTRPGQFGVPLLRKGWKSEVGIVHRTLSGRMLELLLALTGRQMPTAQKPVVPQHRIRLTAATIV
jgi:hypothetical protein